MYVCKNWREYNIMHNLYTHIHGYSYSLRIFIIFLFSVATGPSVSYKLMAEYIIANFLAYSIRDDNQKIPIDCGKCHMKHDVTILLT